MKRQYLLLMVLMVVCSSFSLQPSYFELSGTYDLIQINNIDLPAPSENGTITLSAEMHITTGGKWVYYSTEKKTVDSDTINSSFITGRYEIKNNQVLFTDDVFEDVYYATLNDDVLLIEPGNQEDGSTYVLHKTK